VPGPRSTLKCNKVLNLVYSSNIGQCVDDLAIFIVLINSLVCIHFIRWSGFFSKPMMLIPNWCF